MKKENFESLENVHIYTHADSLTEKRKILIKYRNVIKQNKGITMVALVITIIIMIILVGISVNLTIGNNGIITKAKQAKKDIEEATLNEQVAMNELYDEMMIATGSTSDNISTDGIPDRIIEYIDAKLNAKMLDIYPVGSIYMSTESTNPSELFGGTWESYGEGKTIVGEGSGYEAGTTGGNSTATLATENLPSHNHTIPSLTVSSWNGNHFHHVEDQFLSQYVTSLGGWNHANIGDGGSLGGYAVARASIVNQGEEHLGIPAFNTNQTTITVSGQKTEEGTTSSTGNGTSFNVQDPYIVTYMWKRIE